MKVTCSCMIVLVVVGVIAMTTTTTIASKFIQVNPDANHFIDEFGRTRIFHGVNVVYKQFPFYPPSRTSFNANDSLCEEDFVNLKKWGFNVIRLYLAWQAFEPQRGQYNFTYLDQIESIVRQSAQHDIHVILDVHQDLASPKFCGEGFPDWAIISDWENFPFPVPVNPVQKDAHGIPIIESCLTNPFFKYYLTQPVGKAFQNFYENKNGIRTAFAEMWAQVGKKFNNESNILAYEILNEPWAGDIYTHPWSLAIPGESDRSNLMPLYKEVSDHIRQTDNNHIVMYEPMVADYATVGFLHGPSGSKEYLNRESLSYHIYCVDVDAKGDPRSRFICDLDDDSVFLERMDDIKRLKTAGFLTEFGALSDSEAGSAEIAKITSDADKDFQSWAYWQFKYNADITTMSKPATTESFYNTDGTLQSRKVRSLSRTYAQAICGQPTTMNFDPKSSEFNLKYTALDCAGQPTIVYLNEEWYYSTGFQVTVHTSSSAKVAYSKISTNYLQFVHTADLKAGDVVTIRIVKSS